MEVLAVISRLLDYPGEDLQKLEADIIHIISSAHIDADLKDKLLKFLCQRMDQDLLDWQAQYDAMFERGRSLGLWLFEHVHGESRDRGQAMVDLTEKYREAGLELSQHQLPDYIPLFLEFLSTQGEDNARQWLLEVEHILALLQCRLEKRDSDYAVLFQALLRIAGSELDLSETRYQVSGEKPDNTVKAIDKEWQEEEITFGAQSASDSCGLNRKPSESQRRDQEVPVNWVGFDMAPAISEGVSQ
ncbi:nitrate reductase molybdenum cofactor assembly chaperone [Pseudomaricurvus alkylphenolicus]|uniref:nitrate reductase molybdenum cofactor assembly chaperone n=1 Tax=Pseudomaricurvus alkylphenolicus TaxID=1306991 RepID=UPI001420F550|nr:nitrate reductase molybdenum cofactor assembly chaperone [Pseudomaricurvus alkylphenolicus]NIB42769.1 nitrate reductase molybdenum cofactor assembly chaperone [Pseudomaricurvus alkylphenolicus]